MTADTVAAREVTRASAVRIANHTASELVPAGWKYVSRDTVEPLITLELTKGERGSLVTHQAQVSRLVDARTFDRACRAAWSSLIGKHRGLRGYRTDDGVIDERAFSTPGDF